MLVCASYGETAPHSPTRPTPPPTESVRRAELDRLLELTVRDTGVHAGAIFLLASDRQALRLEVTAGVPAEYLAPWVGVALSSPVAVAEAVRERRQVWLGAPRSSPVDTRARRSPCRTTMRWQRRRSSPAPQPGARCC
ncbi:hypothetical protein [Streptomyces mirabilis]|uniref:hypothetical protein n=1 Tax=Streptomyces mirabilis TaxID=68239 RepID=UPI0036EDD3C1